MKLTNSSTPMKGTRQSMTTIEKTMYTKENVETIRGGGPAPPEGAIEGKTMTAIAWERSMSGWLMTLRKMSFSGMTRILRRMTRMTSWGLMIRRMETRPSVETRLLKVSLAQYPRTRVVDLEATTKSAASTIRWALTPTK